MPLVVVPGCGAVSATIDVVGGRAQVSRDVSVLVRSIGPVVASPALERSVAIRTAVAHHGVKVAAAGYRLETGAVTRLTWRPGRGEGRRSGFGVTITLPDQRQHPPPA